MRTALNRLLLAALGAVLLAIAAAVLAPQPWATDAARWLLPGPLSGLPGLLRSARCRQAVPATAAVLAALWLAAQLPVPRPRRLPLEAHSTLSGRALASAAATEALTLDGIVSARGSLTGGRRHPRLSLRLRLAPGAKPASVAADIERTVLPHAQAAAGRTAITIDVRLRAARRAWPGARTRRPK